MFSSRIRKNGCGKGLNRRAKKIVPSCEKTRRTKNPKQRIRFGAESPQTVIRLLTGILSINIQVVA